MDVKERTINYLSLRGKSVNDQDTFHFIFLFSFLFSPIVAQNLKIWVKLEQKTSFDFFAEEENHNKKETSLSKTTHSITSVSYLTYFDFKAYNLVYCLVTH